MKRSLLIALVLAFVVSACSHRPVQDAMRRPAQHVDESAIPEGIKEEVGSVYRGTIVTLAAYGSLKSMSDQKLTEAYRTTLAEILESIGYSSKTVGASSLGLSGVGAGVLAGALVLDAGSHNGTAKDYYRASGISGLAIVGVSVAVKSMGWNVEAHQNSEYIQIRQGERDQLEKIAASYAHVFSISERQTAQFVEALADRAKELAKDQQMDPMSVFAELEMVEPAKIQLAQQLRTELQSYSDQFKANGSISVHQQLKLIAEGSVLMEKIRTEFSNTLSEEQRFAYVEQVRKNTELLEKIKSLSNVSR